MASPTAEVEAAIEGLYDAFAGYPRPEWFVGCACCWSVDGSVPVPSDRARGGVRVPSPGGGKPLRELTAAELANVAAEVPLTAGTVEVLKHYLPRVLEIAAGEGFDWPDLEVVVARLNDDERVGSTPWTTWPAHEQHGIRAFLHALWRHRLATTGDFEFESVLCAVGTTDPDIDWYLDEWLRFEHPTAARHLEQFLRFNDPAAQGELQNPFWDRERPPVGENLERMAVWLRDPSTKAAIAAGSDRARTSAERHALTECYFRWLP